MVIQRSKNNCPVQAAFSYHSTEHAQFQVTSISFPSSTLLMFLSVLNHILLTLHSYDVLKLFYQYEQKVVTLE